MEIEKRMDASEHSSAFNRSVVIDLGIKKATDGLHAKTRRVLYAMDVPLSWHAGRCRLSLLGLGCGCLNS